MKKIEGYTVDANEKSKKYEGISFSEAIELYKSFPWEDEKIKAEETGCYPAVSFGVLPENSHGEYINIYGYASNKYSLMIEAFLKRPFLGLIPRWKSAFLDVDLAPETIVEEFIMQLFKLPQDELYNWILNYKRFKVGNF